MAHTTKLTKAIDFNSCFSGEIENFDFIYRNALYTFLGNVPDYNREKNLSVCYNHETDKNVIFDRDITILIAN